MPTLHKAKYKDLIRFYEMSKQKHIGRALNEKSLKQFEDEFDDEALVYMCVKQDEQLAGYILLVLEDEEKLQLKRIVIDQEHLGIGLLVLQKVEVYAKKLGKNNIWLDVYTDNKRAIKLYEKAGFRCYDKGLENGREVWFFEKYV